MKKIVTNYPVISFIVITFIYSWTLWLLMILSSKGLLPFKFPTNFLGSFGPAIGGLLVILISNGREGLKELGKKLITVRVGIWVYIFALFFIVFVTLLSLLLVSIFTSLNIEFGSFGGIIEFILYFIIIFFLGGPLGEEIGWRGFLQPKLQAKYNQVVVSLLIAAIWFLWHIPLFWLEGAAQKGDSIINFAILVLCMSILFTWLYNRSKGSLMLALLFHTSINFVTAYINPLALPGLAANNQFNLYFTICLATFTLLLIVFYWKAFTNKAT